jgi:hypothetical protein
MKKSDKKKRKQIMNRETEVYQSSEGMIKILSIMLLAYILSIVFVFDIPEPDKAEAKIIYDGIGEVEIIRGHTYIMTYGYTNAHYRDTVCFNEEPQIIELSKKK